MHDRLLQEKADLEKQFAGNSNFGMALSLRDSISELSAYDNHPGDIGTEVFERGKDLALNEHAERHLMDVEAALALFDKGEYGTCAECGRAIPYRRLDAVPSTAYCIEHAQDKSISQRRPIEEKIMAPPFGRTSLDELDEQNQFDGEDAWQIVSSWGNSNSPAMSEQRDVTDYNDMEVESDENDGYVEDLESFLATDLYGGQVSVIRNKAYYDYLQRKDGDPLLEPDDLEESEDRFS
ncbi:TraR/DksA C4-type zinc finger protein [Paenibacillus sp. CC-CFT747]|nr:TraR/DksA C4-type zinc finger protein [Paenibacillus sp. CC-CFT747]